MLIKLPSPIQKLNSALYEKHGLEVWMKRDDLIHAEISGNKWRKLKFYIEKYKAGNFNALLTFGGAFSNHIAATAAAGKIYNIPTIGVIRGEELNASSNATLKKASENGMKLIFVSREEYSYKEEKEYQQNLRDKLGSLLIVNEGGFGFDGMLGCTEILNEVEEEFDFYAVAAGTGTTLAGLAFGLEENDKLMCFPALKGGEFLKENLYKLFAMAGIPNDEANERIQSIHWELDFHFGGYAKYSNELIDFINDFFDEHEIVLDHIYNGKLMYGLNKKIERGEFQSGTKILVLHTGGVQGLKSLSKRLSPELREVIEG